MFLERRVANASCSDSVFRTIAPITRKATLCAMLHAIQTRHNDACVIFICRSRIRSIVTCAKRRSAPVGRRQLWHDKQLRFGFAIAENSLGMRPSLPLRLSMRVARWTWIRNWKLLLLTICLRPKVSIETWRRFPGETNNLRMRQERFREK